MTSKEQVKAALNHQEPGHVPLGEIEIEATRLFLEAVDGLIDIRDTGGYILCGSQSYIEDIPLENILAIYDENMKGC